MASGSCPQLGRSHLARVRGDALRRAATAVISRFSAFATSDEGFPDQISDCATGNTRPFTRSFMSNPGVAGAFRCAVVFLGSGAARPSRSAWRPVY